MTDAVKVIVVDDQQIIREGIATILALFDGLEVVGTAANGAEALTLARQTVPDVALMDVRMPVMDGVAATRQIRQTLPNCRVLMLTTFDDDDSIIDALRAGASGYLLKDIPGAELAQAVKAVHKGVYQLDPNVAMRVVANLSKPTEAVPPAQPALPAPTSPLAATILTERELQILRLIALGATNREIANQLFITEGTVKNHISNMLARLGLRDRTQAALYAREQGLL